MVIKRDQATKILLKNQEKYLENILIPFGMENSKPIFTPLEASKRFQKGIEGKEKATKPLISK